MSYPVRRPPPLLLIHGTTDPVVPIEQAEALVARVQQASGQARLDRLPGEGHGFNGAALLHAVDRMLTFLDGALKR